MYDIISYVSDGVEFCLGYYLYVIHAHSYWYDLHKHYIMYNNLIINVFLLLR